MKIVFFGSPAFAVPTLQKLIASEHEIIACFSQAPKPAKRGKKLQKTAIHELADQNNIECYTPSSLKDVDIQNELLKLEPDLFVVVAYGLILPQKILDIPKYGAINLHPSKLPKYRGAAPIHRTIMAGESETQICIIKMTAELDSGDILLAKDLTLDDKITTGELHDKAAVIGADLCLEVVNNIENIIPIPQVGEASYANKIQKSEAVIDFSKKGKEIINLIRGLNPYPAAVFLYRDEKIKIFAAEFEEASHDYQLGEVIDDNFSVACSNGIIKPLELQRSGKNKVSITDFLRGFRN